MIKNSKKKEFVTSLRNQQIKDVSSAIFTQV